MYSDVKKQTIQMIPEGTERKDKSVHLMEYFSVYDNCIFYLSTCKFMLLLELFI